MSNALTARNGAGFSLAPQSLTEAMEFARLMANSGMVPDDYKGNPGRVLAAIQIGAEVGLPPMMALQRIYIQNGKPTMDVRGCLAVVQASGYLEEKREEWDAAGRKATVHVKRKGREPIARTFSEADAKGVSCKENGAWITLDQKGTYQSYPERMYTRRALGYALQDEFADILAGVTPWDVVIETVPDGGDQPRNIIEGEVVRQPNGEPATPTNGTIDPEVAAALEKGFAAVHATDGFKRLKLAAYKGREKELVEWLRKEYAAKNGIKPKPAIENAFAGVPDAAPVAAPAREAVADVQASDLPLPEDAPPEVEGDESPIRMIGGELIDTRSGVVVGQAASKMRALAEGPRRQRKAGAPLLDGGAE
jgi:hypothetical protein